MSAIRLARESDLPEMLAISNRAAAETTANFAIEPEPLEAWQLEHHRRGLGRALYRRLFGTLEAQGYRSALAGITQPNDASVKLHESFGMRRVALFEGIGWKFGRWHDVGYWQLCFGQGEPGGIRTVARLTDN